MLVHYFDLKQIFNRLNFIDESLDPANSSETLPLITFQPLIAHQLKTCYDKLSNLLPETHNRDKRGLIDGLGHVVKLITGNLDSKDAERYDSEIEKLKRNQNKIVSATNKQLTLNLEILKKFNDTLAVLNRNQLEIEKHLNRLIGNISRSLITNLILTNLEIIVQILTDLEISLTFARNRHLHTSVIKPKAFLNQLNKMLEIYSPNEMPFNIDLHNIGYYYQVTETSVYYKDMTLNFILSVPITYSENYKQYQLIPIPTKQNYVIKIKKPYITMNNDYYWYSDNKCSKYDKSMLCNFKLPKTHIKTIDCMQLLISKETIKNCTFQPIIIPNTTTIETIDNL